MKTIKEMIEVMQAYEDGAEIEFSDRKHDWLTTKNRFGIGQTLIIV